MADIEKNILDLDYSTYLNWFNLTALFIGTTYVTVIVGTISSGAVEWTVFKILSTAIFTLLLIVFIWLLFYSKLRDIKKSIRNLSSVEITKKPRSFFGALRGVGPFTKKDELKGELE